MAKEFEKYFLGNLLSQRRITDYRARGRKHRPVMKCERFIKTYGGIMRFSLG
jgi:hypothetical protein